MKKLEKLEVFCMTYSEFDEIVKKEYKQEYSFLDSRECGNDTDHLFRRVNGKIEDDYDEEELKEFIEDGKYDYCTTYVIFEDLVRRKVLKPGSYLIEVCW